MRNAAKMISSAASVVAILGSLAMAPTIASAADAAVIEEGKKIAFDRRLGNCLACHMVEGGELPGDIGPPLVAMSARYPDKAKLRAQIWDPRAANPNTIMPPYGAHRILTEDQIDKVVEFIHSL